MKNLLDALSKQLKEEAEREWGYSDDTPDTILKFLERTLLKMFENNKEWPEELYLLFNDALGDAKSYRRRAYNASTQELRNFWLAGAFDRIDVAIHLAYKAFLGADVKFPNQL